MGQYGDVAVGAVDLMRRECGLDPGSAWDRAAALLIRSESSRRKGCPRSAFVSLCSWGLVVGVGVAKVAVDRSAGKNGLYALEALRCLAADAQGSITAAELWKCATASVPDAADNHNGQVDVAQALFKRAMVDLDALRRLDELQTPS